MTRIRNRVVATIRRGKRQPTQEEVQNSLPTFWPVITILVILIEIGLMVAVIVTGGLAPIRLGPEDVSSPLVGFDNQQENGFKQIVPNFFIGSSKESLIHSGAMYTPVS